MEKSVVKLFVGGLPADIDEIELVQLLAIYGEILTVKVVRDRMTNHCKGYGFLEMANVEAAENLIKLMDGKTFRKKNLVFNLAKEKVEVIIPVEQVSLKSHPIYKMVTSEASLSKKRRPRINR
jgi:RNA recognition motif-containing protein